MRFEVLNGDVEVTAIWNTAPCSLVDEQLFLRILYGWYTSIELHGITYQKIVTLRAE
jgi:hypothetical protein